MFNSLKTVHRTQFTEERDTRYGDMYTNNKMAVLCGMPQYSIRLEAVRYLCTSCLLPAFDDA